eukprot:scaffold3.g6636.t1
MRHSGTNHLFRCTADRLADVTNMLAAVKRGCAAALAQLNEGLSSLRGSPRDLWLIFVLKVLESYNYFSLSRIFVLFLTEDFGISDVAAGTYYGLWGTLLTAYGFLGGGAIDWLGVKASLIVCFLLNVTSRLVMAATSSRAVLLAALLGPNTMAGEAAGAEEGATGGRRPCALGVPVMTIGVKRYTNDANRGFCFSLFYSLMNCAAFVQGMLLDVFRIRWRRGFNLPSLPPRSLLNSGNRLFLASGCITSLAGLLISFALSSAGGAPAPLPAKRSRSDAVEAGGALGRAGSPEPHSSVEVELPSPDLPLLGAPAARPSSAGSAGSVGADLGPRGLNHHNHRAQQQQQQQQSAEGGSSAPAARGAAAHAAQQHDGGSFWFNMCVLCINLKAVFRHLDALLSKYQLRSFGCDAPVGLVYSINPFCIVFLVPIVGALTTRYEPFDMIHWGGYISALSVFWMVAFDTLWATAAFVAMLSLGEAIWSPRWYDYSMAVAPQGREGIFTSLASAPLFAATLPTGMLSGWLLQRYCPDRGQCVDDDPGGGGPGASPAPLRRLLGSLAGDAPPLPPQGGKACDGRTMWLIVGLLTLSSPVAVLFTQRWIRPSPKDFSRVRALHRRPTLLEGEHAVETDPLAVLEEVSFAAASHDQEAPLVPHPRSASRASDRSAG